MSRRAHILSRGVLQTEHATSSASCKAASAPIQQHVGQTDRHAVRQTTVLEHCPAKQLRFPIGTLPDNQSLVLRNLGSIVCGLHTSHVEDQKSRLHVGGIARYVAFLSREGVYRLLKTWVALSSNAWRNLRVPPSKTQQAGIMIFVEFQLQSDQRCLIPQAIRRR